MMRRDLYDNAHSPGNGLKRGRSGVDLRITPWNTPLTCCRFNAFVTYPMLEHFVSIMTVLQLLGLLAQAKIQEE